MSDLLERFDALRAAVRISIRQELADHYDMNLGECYLFLDAMSPGIDESRDAYLARWQDAMAEIARLRARLEAAEKVLGAAEKVVQAARMVNVDKASYDGLRREENDCFSVGLVAIYEALSFYALAAPDAAEAARFKP